jgi:hypothetical protein
VLPKRRCPKAVDLQLTDVMSVNDTKGAVTLLNDLIGTREQYWRHFEAERLGGL